MPNWVTNIIHTLNPNADLREFTDEEGNFTFQKIVPMPDDIFRGNLGAEERKKYGSKNWYDWSLIHWGTKWDACEPHTYENTAIIETAWSCPVPVLIELGKKVGGILVLYADEDTGSNCGGFIVKKNGEVVDLDNNYIMAVAIHGTDLSDWDAVEQFSWLIEEDD